MDSGTRLDLLRWQPDTDEPEARPTRAPARNRRRARGLLATARPRQWVKNVLVAAAPFTAGVLFEPAVARATGVAFVAVCLTASGVYFVNDARDAPRDRAHPVKRWRPVAAGIVPVAAAYAMGALLLTLGVATGAVAGSSALGFALTGYAAMSLAYCYGLKDQPVLDLATIATGFLLRAVAGGLAAGIALSPHFLIVAAFGSLFMAAGKRYSEAVTVGAGQAATRASLARYTATYLRFVWGMAAAVTIGSYGLWAFEIGARTGENWAAISIIPFVLCLMRYAADIDRGDAEAPEEIALRDRVLQGLAVAWVTCLSLAVLW
jgi:decaprenyl-phosphate phosphoribosyltransferase